MTNPLIENDDLAQIKSMVNLNDTVITQELEPDFTVTPDTVSQLQDVIWADGARVRPANADVNYSNGTYTVTTADGDSNNQNAISFESSKTGAYTPGEPFYFGEYVQKSSAPVGHLDIGYFRNNQDNGPWLRWKSDGSWEFIVANGGKLAKIPQSSWTGGTAREVTNEDDDVVGEFFGFDKMDGSGPSGIDLTNGVDHVVHIIGAWYGGGALVPSILTMDDKGNYRPHPIGVFEPKNDISFEQPNQPVTARLDNEGGSTEDSVEIAGRQYSSAGESSVEKKKAPHFSEGGVTVGTSYTPVAAFKRKQGEEGTSIDAASIEIQTDQRLFAYLEINADIDDANTTFQDPSTVMNSSETSIEVADPDNSSLATNQRGAGTSYGVEPSIFGAGKNDAVVSESGPSDFPIAREDVVVLWAKTVTGQSATIEFAINFEEAR